MKLFDEIRYRARRLLLPAAVVLILVYTYYQMLNGQRGLVAWYTLRQQVIELEQQNLALKGQVAQMQEKVTRLQNGTADADYLDELARRTLPTLHPDELVIFLENGELPPMQHPADIQPAAGYSEQITESGNE